jgi:predicted phosphodiesterase
MKMTRLLSWLAVLALLGACAGTTTSIQPAEPELQASKSEPPVFQSDVSGELTPWTHDNFDNEEGKFTFAVFSDLTGGERPGVFEVAVAQLNLLRPEFIVNVGDLIEGGTTDNDQLSREWQSFDQRAGIARAPVFYTGGNHDLTNPRMWEVWEERYGRRYYHFLYKDTLFLVLDTEDNPPEFQRRISDIRDEAIRIIDEQGWEALPETEYGKLIERKSGRISAQQAEYFREVIAQNPDVRWTFLLMHKPAWERPNEENFATMESALQGRPYTVFYGHVHSYLHEQRHGRDYVRLATTGGVQNPAKDMAIDHVTLVTVSGDTIDIANLRMSGIFDRTGKIPAGGEDLCFEAAKCE